MSRSRAKKSLCVPYRRYAIALLWCVGISLLPTTGCGDGMARVTGVVSLDGKPIAASQDTRCTVTFVRKDGTGAASTGVVDNQGTYTLGTGASTGVLPGTYMVSISASQLMGEEQIGVPRSGKRLTPPEYGDATKSGLEATVEPGNNTFDFELSSTGP
jgi:hypothetical protein